MKLLYTLMLMAAIGLPSFAAADCGKGANCGKDKCACATDCDGCKDGTCECEDCECESCKDK